MDLLPEDQIMQGLNVLQVVFPLKFFGNNVIAYVGYYYAILSFLMQLCRGAFHPSWNCYMHRPYTGPGWCEICVWPFTIAIAAYSPLGLVFNKWVLGWETKD